MSDFKELYNIINENLKIRNCLINFDESIIYDIIFRDLHQNIGELISSKGIIRLKCFYHFTNGKNYIDKNKKINWFENVNPKYLAILNACFIIIGQVFSDGNHRTAYKLLVNSEQFNLEEIDSIIDKIKNIRNIIKTDFNNQETVEDYLSFSDYIYNMHLYYKQYFIGYII